MLRLPNNLVDTGSGPNPFEVRIVVHESLITSTSLFLELPWFGEMPGYYNTNPYGGGGPMMHYPPPSAGGYGYPYQGGMPVPNPGHSIVIQPGMNGAPPTITQMPLSA